ncbi:HET-domain-containing protein [Acephala macrosclerotiorum]|nr:HET-domain-containing protein [Acephala macrosclerotiorum]
MSSKSCEVCTPISSPDGWPSQQTARVAAFQSSAKEGCLDCAMILDAVEEWHKGWATDHTLDGTIDLNVLMHVLNVTLQPVNDPALDGKSGRFTLWQHQEKNAEGKLTKPFLSSMDIISNTNSREAFKRAFDWLDHCAKYHDHSAEADSSSKFIPSRLLDVGQPDPSWSASATTPEKQKRDTLHLIEARKKFRGPVQYAALSYCWGGDLEGVITTVKETIDKHCENIAVRSLPRTLQDAITVCRGMRIRYLWIDALCIVQDDDKDWRREAAQMRHVYSNSLVTLAAHLASSCKDGFLGKQEYGQADWQRGFTTRRKLRFSSNSFGQEARGTEVVAFEGPASQKKIFIRTRETPKWLCAEPTPLMKRGWAFQECILPRRIIHFTGFEMVWECTKAHFCECSHVEGYNGKANPMTKTWLGDLPEVNPVAKPLKTWGLTPYADKNIKVRPVETCDWMDFVKEYTGRELSRPSDRLVALSGLALSLQASPSESNATLAYGQWTVGSQPKSLWPVYVAGLIRTFLPQQLLWYAQDQRKVIADADLPLPAISRPTPYRAPTWSWASLDGPILYESKGSYESHVSIDEAGTFCVPTDAFHPSGPVSDGELLLDGLLAPVKLVTAERRIKRRSWDVSDNWTGRASIVRSRYGASIEVTCDLLRQIEMRKGDPGYDCWVRGDCPLSSNMPSSETTCDECKFRMERTPEFWCLKVATRRHHENEWLWFLLLQRADSVKGLAWERVGLGVIPKVKNDERSDEDVKLFEGARVERIRIV